MAWLAVLPLDRDRFEVLGASRATVAARLEARAGALRIEGGMIGNCVGLDSFKMSK